METTNLSSLSLPEYSCKTTNLSSLSLPKYSCKCPRWGTLAVRAGRETTKGDGWGNPVDDNMIVLRMRMKEMKMLEKSYEPPQEWMEWEKKYYEHYNKDICEAVGLLQNYFMSVRPSLALGTLAFLVLSVMICTGVAMCQAVEITKMILSYQLVF
ncbi:hypothetical protein K2173_001329 [Erythroxylum novogranatense]|uniref:Uncharacterized protein n=1 Tax=Erythroxylum novogranatense TaxID=1862640 RepID=A0AAV8T4Y9_9ROSI|nr:hypothetical protein K2173_001329 [Erythroxylum novogranatense]